MPMIEFAGKNTEEAIEKACNQLHVSPDQLKFEIVSTGSSGIFGLGSKKAVIRVTIEEKISTRNEYNTGESINRVNKPERDVPETHSDYPVLNAKTTRNERPRTAEKKEISRTERPRREYPKDVYVTDSKSEDIPLPPTMAAPGEEIHEGPDDEAMIQARETLHGILKHMEIQAQVNVKRIGDRVVLGVVGDNSGLLIGKKGSTLDALQFLLNKIVNRNRTDKHRIIVDTEDYRQRRHQSLIDLANRMAEKAKRTRRPVTISQLSAHDRRVVHLALNDKTGLKTRSRGDGPLKNVVIIPGGRRPDMKAPAVERIDPDMGEQ
jgi:spoIIIJ-associated protein